MRLEDKNSDIESNMKIALDKNIWKYYLFSFFREVTIFLPFIVYYFQQIGLTLTQIAILMSTTAITVFIAEIPSGYVADKIGKKNSLIIGAIFSVLAVITLYTAQNFTILILAQILLGLSDAFFSGADSAFLYESLLFIKKEDSYKKIEGKAKFFAEIAIILSAILGSLIVAYGIKQTILLTLIAYMIALIAIFSFKEPPIEIREKKMIHLEILELFTIIKKSLQNKKLLGLFLYSFIVLGVSSLIFVIYQPYFRATTLPVYYYGYIFAAFSVFAALSAYYAESIEKRLGVYWSLVLAPIFLVCALIGSSILFIWIGFVFFFFRELVRGFIFPVLNDYTNKITNSNERATVLSIESMFSRIGFVIISTTFGFLSDSHGMKLMLLITGITLLIFTIIVLVLIRNESSDKKY